jgi:hypothetical protein
MYRVMTSSASVEMYDAVHAECLKRVDASVDGLRARIGRAATDGVQTLEVWESKEHYDRANTDIVFPLMRELAGDERAARGSRQRKPSMYTASSSPRQRPDLADWGESGMRARPRTHSHVTSATP